MSAMSLIGKLLDLLTKAGPVVGAVERVASRISRRPPVQTVYKDEHCWSRESPNEPPVYCYYCRQLRQQASRYCPGVPPREVL